MKIKKLTLEQKKLRIRILEISHQARTSHIGSCISVIDVVDAIYQLKKKNDRFVLSNGHSGVALYVVLEKKGILKNPNLTDLNVHPDRNLKIGIDVSSGSLGQGLPIAVGMAIADRKRNVYCITSDGECAEGSIWEALRIAVEQKLSNLIIIVVCNGWGAYDPISLLPLVKRLEGFVGKVKIVDGHNLKKLGGALVRKRDNKPLIVIAQTQVDQLPFLKGQDAHYYVMSDDDYKIGKELLHG